MQFQNISVFLLLIPDSHLVLNMINGILTWYIINAFVTMYFRKTGIKNSENMKNKIVLIICGALLPWCLLIAQIRPERPDNFKSWHYKYTIEDLQKKYSDSMMKKAAIDMKQMNEVNTTGRFSPYIDSLKTHLLPDWYRDAKFGIFFDWGLYSIAGYDEIGFKRAAYPDWYLKNMEGPLKTYHDSVWGSDFKRDDFIPLFTARGFNADEIISLVKQSGAKYFIPFNKHHDGFCLWNSEYTQRNVVDMFPGRDLTAELVEACKKYDVKHGFYFSVEDYEYPVITKDKSLGLRLWSNDVQDITKVKSRDDVVVLNFNSPEHNKIVSGKVPVVNFIDQYIVPQAKNYIDKYDPDILWFDGEWTRKAEYYKTPDLVAYFYNKALGRKEVAANDRMGIGTREHCGDFYTSETDEITTTTDHIWEENRSMGASYGYCWKDNDASMLSADQLIKMLVRIVAKNGNMLLLVSPDGSGKIPDSQVYRLKEIGEWLKVNGESIYNTRPYYVPCQNTQLGQTVWYTRSKDGKYGYAIIFEMPQSAENIILTEAKPVWHKNVYFLGCEKPLKPGKDWVDTGKSYGMVVKIPAELRDPKNRPCKYAWVIKYETR
jgi:alpha-L-fucosidase